MIFCICRIINKSHENTNNQLIIIDYAKNVYSSTAENNPEQMHNLLLFE